MILWNDEKYTKKINSGVFPGTQGGPLMNQIAGKTQAAYYEASKSEFKQYGQDVLDMRNRHMCEVLKSNGIKITTDGTDSHIILIHTGDKSGVKLQINWKMYTILSLIRTVYLMILEVYGKLQVLELVLQAMVTKMGPDKSYFTKISEQIVDIITN